MSEISNIAAAASHKFLTDFLAKYDESVRGGMHDFMEISISNMLGAAIENMSAYMEQGHREVNANHLVFIALDAYQKTLDRMKRDLDGLQDMVLQ